MRANIANGPKGLPLASHREAAFFEDGRLDRRTAFSACDGVTAMRANIDRKSGAEPAAAVQERSVFTSEDERRLREALKRCSPVTREAACAYRRTGNPDYLPVVIHGLVEHYVVSDARTKLSGAGDEVRLLEDLAIDSLTMMEIVFLAEDVLQVSIDNEELRPFGTLGDIKRLVATKLAPLSQH